MKKNLSLLLGVALMTFMITGCGSSTDQTGSAAKANSDFPKKPIEMIVPFASGGATDISARIIADSVNKYLPNGQSVMVVNAPGGAAIIGMTEVVSAKPDGYTIGYSTLSPISGLPHFGQTSYEYDSFQPIMRTLASPLVLAVKADAPWKDFDAWLEDVKQNPDTFTYGTPGTGGGPHIVMEGLNQVAGLKTKQVPFDGGGSAKTALLGGHVQGAILQIHEATGDFDSGTLRPLINLGETKVEVIKDLPTLKDKGFDVAVETQTGIFAPKGVPKEIQDILHDAFKRTLEDPEVIEKLQKTGVSPAYMSSEDFQKNIATEYEFFGKVLKSAGMVQ